MRGSKPRRGLGIGRQTPASSSLSHPAPPRPPPPTEAIPLLPRVVDPAESGLPRVHLDPIVCGAPAARTHGPRCALPFHEELGDLRISGPRDANGHRPPRLRIRGPRDVLEQEARLGERHRGIPVPPLDPHVEDREPRLRHPRTHEGPDGLAGGLLERLPAVLPPRIGVAVGLEIGPDRAPENVPPEELLAHPEDRRSFAVTDLVEDLADLG